MDSIAFLVGPYSIYWSTVIQVMAALAGVLLFWFFYLWDEHDCPGAFCVVPLALTGAVILGRLFHWYFRQDSYRSLSSALTDYSYGGFALLGCFAGVFLAACLMALLRRGRHFGAMLDALSVAGVGAVGIGRLSGFCNTADRGQILENPSFWGTSLVNSATGIAEYRLATFLLQAAAAGVIFLVLTFLFFWRRVDHRRKPGDIFWLFCLYYGASQAVLDSTRYDSLYFRSNGFVSVVQIACVAAILLPLAVFALRYRKSEGWMPGCMVLLLSCAVLLAGGSWMEYYVQRHGNQAAFAYTVMSCCMLGIAILGTALWYVTRKREIPRSLPTIYPSL